MSHPEETIRRAAMRAYDEAHPQSPALSHQPDKVQKKWRRIAARALSAASASQASMLRPIDGLSRLVGDTGLVRADRLEREADEIAAQNGRAADVLDRRHHADLIREIHQLSNPDFDTSN